MHRFIHMYLRTFNRIKALILASINSSGRAKRFGWSYSFSLYFLRILFILYHWYFWISMDVPGVSVIVVKILDKVYTVGRCPQFDYIYKYFRREFYKFKAFFISSVNRFTCCMVSCCSETFKTQKLVQSVNSLGGPIV